MILKLLELIFTGLKSILAPNPSPSLESQTKAPLESQLGPKLEINKLSRLGKADIVLREGIILSKYKDTEGVWTIGIGATKSEIPDLAGWSLSKTLTLEDAFKYFNVGLQKYELAVKKALTVDIPQHQFDALVSITYNIGVSAMQKSTFMRKINAKAPMSEIKAAIMMWTANKELISRRKSESELFELGLYKNNSLVGALIPVSTTYLPLYHQAKNIDISPYL